MIYIVILLMACTVCFSQDSLSWQFGFGAGYNINSHSTDLQRLPGFASCCPQYESGSGGGLNIGAFGARPFAEDLFYGGRIGLSNISALLLAYEYEKTDNSLGTVTDGIFEHTIDASLLGFFIRPEITYSPVENLYIGLGPEIFFLLGGSFVQQEKIIEPTDVTFENDRITRNEFEDKIPGTNALQFGFSADASYYFPVNDEKTAFLGPYISYTTYFTDLVNYAAWKSSTFAIGLNLRYDLFDKKPLIVPPPPPPPDTPAVITVIPPKDTSDIKSRLRVYYFDESGDDTIIVENMINRSYEALLNYIFFADNSAQLPPKLNLISPAEAKEFSTNKLALNKSLGTYYDILNIFGYRLKADPKLAFEIIGCNSGVRDEKNNTGLSHERALSVQRYLSVTWGIDTNRLKITVRNLPENPSRSENEFAEQENRRVELIPNKPQALMPVMLEDTLRQVSEKVYMEFVPEVTSLREIKDWSIDIKQKGAPVKSFKGTGSPSGKTVWDLTGDDKEVPESDADLDMSLTVTDDLGTTATVPADAVIGSRNGGADTLLDDINIKQTLIRKTKKEKFSLILFGFNDASISEVGNLVTDFIKTRIEEGSDIDIEGYTDIIGNNEYNKKLAQSRAEAVAKNLNVDVKFAKGKGMSSELYDNNIPEGRYYNRTVIITVETRSEE